MIQLDFDDRVGRGSGRSTRLNFVLSYYSAKKLIKYFKKIFNPLLLVSILPKELSNYTSSNKYDLSLEILLENYV